MWPWIELVRVAYKTTRNRHNILNDVYSKKTTPNLPKYVFFSIYRLLKLFTPCLKPRVFFCRYYFVWINCCLQILNSFSEKKEYRQQMSIHRFYFCWLLGYKSGGNDPYCQFYQSTELFSQFFLSFFDCYCWWPLSVYNIKCNIIFPTCLHLRHNAKYVRFFK